MHRRYSESEKQDILHRYLSGEESVASISGRTDIPRSTLYHWINTHKNQSPQPTAENVNIAEFHRMQSKVERMEQIIKILKSIDCTVNAPLKQKLRTAEQLHGQYSVHLICEALDLSRGTFYNHVLRNKKDNTWYAKRREELRIQIQNIYDESNQIFGAEKIASVIRSNGTPVSVEMVRRLMREMGLYSIRQNSKKLYDDEYRKRPNHVNQNFNPSRPNEIWVSDVTYFKFNNHAFYICAIIDLFSRMVIACKIGKTNSTQLVKSTFRTAYNKRKPNGNLIYHTDRGSNYCSKSMTDCLKSLNVTHSFSRVYIPYDNSVMETFFSSMKREELYRTKYRSESEFRAAIDEYIRFYNEKRPHKKLHYKTPQQKEEEFALQAIE